MKDLSHHPVWDVYDQLRTSRLNVKYHAGLLRKYRRINFWLELILAISAPTSAVAGLVFWKTEIGAVLWRVFAVIAALVAVAKPLLGVANKIAKLEEILVGYKSFEHDLQCLTIAINQERKYAEVNQQRFSELLEKKRELITRNKVEIRDKRLLRICQQEVRSELPPESFFIPED